MESTQEIISSNANHDSKNALSRCNSDSSFSSNNGHPTDHEGNILGLSRCSSGNSSSDSSDTCHPIDYERAIRGLPQLSLESSFNSISRFSSDTYQPVDCSKDIPRLVRSSSEPITRFVV